LRHCPITMDIKPVGIARVEAKPADCLLMASESDLMDFLEYRGLRVVLIETPQSSSASGYIVAAVIGGPVSGVATTRIGALVAAVVAVGGGER
jgi:hypothetical protein